jgi:hypothetical protein
MPTMTTTAQPLSNTAFDRTLLRRVHLASAVLTLLFGMMIALRVDARWAAGFTLAGLWSTANFWALEALLRAAVRPDGRSAGKIALASLVKIPILYGLLLLLVMRGGMPGTSLVVGLSVPLLVIVLKVMGRSVAFRDSISERSVHGRADLT